VISPECFGDVAGQGFEADVGTKSTFDFSNRENARRILKFTPRDWRNSTLLFFEVCICLERSGTFREHSGPVQGTFSIQATPLSHSMRFLLTENYFMNTKLAFFSLFVD
jgi:hypothetical protein